MPANEITPYKELGTVVSVRASAAVTGATLVVISGNRTGGGGGGAEGSTTVGVGLSTDGENLYKVATAGAGVRAFGVAAWDIASGGEGKVYCAGHGTILPILAAGTIAAGEKVMSDAAGKVIAYVEGAGKVPIGECLNGITTGKNAEILFY